MTEHAKVPDWNTITRRVRRRRTRNMLIAAITVLVTCALPALALGGSLRELLGISEPRLDRATLLAAATIGDGRSIRLWQSPSTSGGECLFLSFERADTDKRPSAPNTAACSVRGPVDITQRRLNLGFSPHPRRTMTAGERTPPHLFGSVSSSGGIVRIELRWRHGRLPIPLRGRYFVAITPILDQPAFEQLPIRVVAYNAEGTIVESRQISSQGLYIGNEKRAQLIAFARTHPDRKILQTWNR